MFLPGHVQKCIDLLEQHGFACYAVGGCVRDALLGLTPLDYDLCTDALPTQTRAFFSDSPLVLAGEKHGTVGVVTDAGVVEITTFRTEGDYTDSRHPGWIKFVKTIEGDLARRDFTVNAVAYSPTRGFVDPFGGQQDLKNRILRAVGDAPARFTEDALRILRGVRFAVRYQLTPESATISAMLAQAPLLENIAKERIFDELCKLLPLVTAEDLLTYCPIFTQIIPELAPAVGFAQHSMHHAYDVFTHTAQVCAATPPDLTLRWAALLHDIGKISTFTLDEDGQGHFYGHASVSAQMADTILRRLKAPTALREDVLFLIEHHMDSIEPDKKLLRRWVSRRGIDRVKKLLVLQKADFCSKGVSGAFFPFDRIDSLLQTILEEEGCITLGDLAVSGHDLIAMGLAGPVIGTCLNQLLSQVINEEIPNEKAALLAAVERMIL